MTSNRSPKETENLMYDAFRRALGAWIVTDEDGSTRFEIGEWADSPAACMWPSYANSTVKYVGWIAGSDMGGSGPCGEAVAATTTEFAEFLMNEDFVLWGSPEAIAAAVEFEEKFLAPFRPVKIARVR